VRSDVIFTTFLQRAQVALLSFLLFEAFSTAEQEIGLQITRWIPEPVNLTVMNDGQAQGFSDRELKKPTVKFPTGAQMQLLIYTPSAYYVQGRTVEGSVEAAWVSPLNLSPVPPTLLADAKNAEALRILLEAAIDRREIIIGMTSDDVRKSLGRPWRVLNGEKPEEPKQTWVYIHYERAPRTDVFTGSDNLLYAQTTYQQIPAGRLKVAFRNGRVTGYTVEVDQPEGFFERRTDGNVIISPDQNPVLAPEDAPVP
jgi:hypothetical protein